MPRLSYPKGKQVSTGSDLIDTLLGLSSPDPTLGPAPIALGGVFKELISQRLAGTNTPTAQLKKYAPGLYEELVKKIQFEQSPPTDMLLTELQSQPGFRRFQELIAQNLRRVYGNIVPFFRGMHPDEIAGMRGARKIGFGNPSDRKSTRLNSNH